MVAAITGQGRFTARPTSSAIILIRASIADGINRVMATIIVTIAVTHRIITGRGIIARLITAVITVLPPRRVSWAV